MKRLYVYQYETDQFNGWTADKMSRDILKNTFEHNLQEGLYIRYIKVTQIPSTKMSLIHWFCQCAQHNTIQTTWRMHSRANCKKDNFNNSSINLTRNNLFYIWWNCRYALSPPLGFSGFWGSTPLPPKEKNHEQKTNVYQIKSKSIISNPHFVFVCRRNKV